MPTNPILRLVFECVETMVCNRFQCGGCGKIHFHLYYFYGFFIFLYIRDYGLFARKPAREAGASGPAGVLHRGTGVRGRTGIRGGAAVGRGRLSRRRSGVGIDRRRRGGRVWRRGGAAHLTSDSTRIPARSAIPVCNRSRAAMRYVASAKADIERYSMTLPTKQPELSTARAGAPSLRSLRRCA